MIGPVIGPVNGPVIDPAMIGPDANIM